MLEGLTFDDVIIRPRKGVLEHRADADIRVSGLSLDIPLIAAPMPSVASVDLMKEMERLGGGSVVNRMQRTLEQRWQDVCDVASDPDVAIGLDIDEFKFFYDNHVRVFWLDIAHGHTNAALEFIEHIKNHYRHTYIVSGSIATEEAAWDLINVGVDALRVGIGPGSVCTTRQVTGFGVPQLEAIEDAKRASFGTPIIADGGIRNSGDIVKALAAGADAVMIGSLFANSFEANSETHYGNASHGVNGHRAPEGIEKPTEEKEPLEDIVKRLTWGIRSGISYAGATNIKELQESAEWIKLTDAGRRESKLV